MREYFQIITRRFGILNKTCCAVDGVEVSLVQSHILYEIHKTGNPSIQQVADILGIDITTISRQIQTLVKLALVEKIPSPEDKRVTLLSLTELGVRVAEGIDRQVNDDLTLLFSQMTEFERETVQRSVKLLADVMNKSGIGCESDCSDNQCS